METCAVAHVKCPSLHAVPYLMIFYSFFSTHLVPILDDWQSRPSDYPTPESTIHMGSGEVPLVGNSRSPADVQSCTGTEPSPMVWTTYSSASTGPGHSYQGTVHTIVLACFPWPPRLNPCAARGFNVFASAYKHMATCLAFGTCSKTVLGNLKWSEILSNKKERK